MATDQPRTLFLTVLKLFFMYDYFLPTVNFFGNGSVNVTGERCKILGTKKDSLLLMNF